MVKGIIHKYYQGYRIQSVTRIVPVAWSEGSGSVFAPGRFGQTCRTRTFRPLNVWTGLFAPWYFGPGRVTPWHFGPGCFTPWHFGPGRFAPCHFGPGSFAPERFGPWCFAPVRFGPGRLPPPPPPLPPNIVLLYKISISVESSVI